MRDRLERIRSVISWIPDVGTKIAQGIRFVFAAVNFANAIADPHFRIA